jgi:putative PIN family toxin of toxin-antitoxin system
MVYALGVRIAIDTNVLIAALTRPGGRSARIVDAWLAGEIEAVASEATAREAELVLGAGWLARMTSRERVTSLLEALRSRTVWVCAEPITDLQLKDEGDVRMVETAVTGGASYVVTTDRSSSRTGATERRVRDARGGAAVGLAGSERGRYGRRGSGPRLPRTPTGRTGPSGSGAGRLAMRTYSRRTGARSSGGTLTGRTGSRRRGGGRPHRQPRRRFAPNPTEGPA